MSAHVSRRLLSSYLLARSELHTRTATSTSISAAPNAAAERRLRALRDRLVAHYCPLARRVARSVAPQPPAPFDHDDVVSWAMQGLLQAVHTFDPNKGARFESYATSKIRWSILDEMRRADTLSRGARHLARRTLESCSRLEQQLGRVPTDNEIARHAGIPLSKQRTFLEHRMRAPAVSLDAPLQPGPARHRSEETPPAGGFHDMLADPSSGPEATLHHEELRARLARAIATLPERQQLVVTSYFYAGMKLKEIAAELSLTEGRISQILHLSLSRLRDELAGEIGGLLLTEAA